MGLLARIVQYLQLEAEYEERVIDFMQEHACHFKPGEDLGAEQSLEKFAIFKKYEAMVDDILQSMCYSQGFQSGQELYAALQSELKGKPLSRIRGGYIKAILADTTYEGFLASMLEHAEKHAERLCREDEALQGRLASEVSVHGQGPFAGWTLEEAAVLSGAGLLPSLPAGGEAVWGFLSDATNDGRWVVAIVQSMPEGASGVVVSWLHSGESALLPLEHIQRLPATGEKVWAFCSSRGYGSADGGQWLTAVAQQVASDGAGLVVCWQHDGSQSVLPYEYIRRC